MSPRRGRMARCVHGVVGRPGGKGEELCGCPWQAKHLAP